MTIFTGIILYLMIFWLTIFAVLPVGNRISDTVEEGNVHSAPDNPRIREKFIATAIISAFLWCVAFVLIENKVIDFHSIARQMSQADGVQ